MTRSVEIPEAELQRVTGILHEFEHGRLNSICPGVDDCQLWYDAEIRTAYLLPALPYLAPAGPSEAFIREQGGRAARGKDHEPGPWCRKFNCTWHAAAPVGDGGLREALEAQAAVWEGFTSSDPDVQVCFELAAGKIRELLAAHPAAPAVPQPVDREALLEALKFPGGGCSCERQCRETGAHREHLADAVLAVLAGEQEQVEK